jgi:pSer/pThr/pTyr-binding forkhead associated (FHA) protein
MRVKIKMLVGKSAGKEITIPVKHFLIGRSEDCHLRPKSDAISRNHCAILTQGGKVLLRDLNSRNGTFLNGEKIDGDAAVKSGDHVQIGKLEFEMLIKAPKKEKKPEPAKASAESKDSESLDFDISEWLDEADGSESAKRESEPETRQFQLDETDRLALSEAAEKVSDDSAQSKVPEKQKSPGKLPDRPGAQAETSRDAAADMLKKFFNSR